MIARPSLEMDQLTVICEPNLRHQCQPQEGCLHYQLPYQWQFLSQTSTWNDFPQNVEIEHAFSQPSVSCHSCQMVLNNTEVPMQITFEKLKIECTAETLQFSTDVRRLSTPSYISDTESVLNGGKKKTERFVTQWRWYYCGSGSWQEFGKTGRIPQQYLLEAKFLSGQPIYRFRLDAEGDFTITFQPGRQQLMSLKTGSHWEIRRRPLFLQPSMVQPLESPVANVSPFVNSVPSNWFPVDSDQDYELVPLDPSCMEFHLVASAFHESIGQVERRVVDVFRVQNAFLWHKYSSKRQHMEFLRTRLSKESGEQVTEVTEKQLFHGTRDERAVQSIFRQNFDWRLSGSANDYLYGRGAYFARNAKFSDRYSANSSSGSRLNWMFLARVLVGRSAVGVREYLRPPPLNPSVPDGELYDSCVNDLSRPVIYVIFDIDQCYPEYVISYV